MIVASVSRVWAWYAASIMLLISGLAMPWVIITQRERTAPTAGSHRREELSRPRMIVVPLAEREAVERYDWISDWKKSAYKQSKEYRILYRLSIPFAISDTEISQKQYTAIMGENPSHYRCGDCPVENVSWYDAAEFCNRLSAQEGLAQCYEGGVRAGYDTVWKAGCTGYRLPTEAEWETAARGGQSDVRYAGTSDEREVCVYGNVSDQRAIKEGELPPVFLCDDEYAGLAPVAHYRHNAYHLFDMTGNVWEWVWDRWEERHMISPIEAPPGPPALDPRGPITGQTRVVRGGSWRSDPRIAQITYRYGVSPSDRDNFLGFRVARSLFPLDIEAEPRPKLSE